MKSNIQSISPSDKERDITHSLNEWNVQSFALNRLRIDIQVPMGISSLSCPAMTIGRSPFLTKILWSPLVLSCFHPSVFNSSMTDLTFFVAMLKMIKDETSHKSN